MLFPDAFKNMLLAQLLGMPTREATLKVDESRDVKGIFSNARMA